MRAAAPEALLMVDCVTSLGGEQVSPTEWSIDYAYSCSQKSLGCPPGLEPVHGVAARARTGRATARRPSRSSFDIDLLEKYWVERPMTYHHTMPILQYYALYEGIRLALEEGLENRWARHEDAGRYFQDADARRAATRSCRPRPPARGAHRRSTCPRASTARRSRRRILREHNIEVGGGLGPKAPPIWRVGLMGVNANRETADRVLAAFDAVLPPRRPPMAAKDRLTAASSPSPARTCGRWRRPPTLGADVVFLDLEDAVAPDDKEQARANVIEALRRPRLDAARAVSVRINGLDTHWCYRDVVDVVESARRRARHRAGAQGRRARPTSSSWRRCWIRSSSATAGSRAGSASTS